MTGLLVGDHRAGLCNPGDLIKLLELERGLLRTVLDDWSAVELSVYAVYPSRRHVLPKVRAFVDFLVEGLHGGGGRAGN